MMKINSKLKTIPNVSVIIPFYNAEKWIARCLDSVVISNNIEIICVNDGSTDRSLKIVQSYKKKYNFIKIIHNKKNRGLYISRLSGVQHARGKYIGFLDSDDYVSPGYFSNLYQTAMREKSDIVVGIVVNQNKDNVQYIQSRCKIFPYSENKEFLQIYDMYWQQEGQCYHWNTLWNKIYKRELWTREISILKKQKKHLVMLEDFVFSSVVLSKAKNFAVDINAKYYYVEHIQASTHDFTSVNRFIKNIMDMYDAFLFVEKFLNNHEEYNKYLLHFQMWKERYSRYWYRNICSSDMTQNDINKCLKIIENKWKCKIEEIRPEDEFYYEIAEIIEK